MIDLTNVIEKVADLLAGNYSNSELRRLFEKTNISYVEIESKKKNVVNTFASVINEKNSANYLFKFMEINFNPVSFIGEKDKYDAIISELNKIFSFIGYKITENGKIIAIQSINNLRELDQKYNSYIREFEKRKFNRKMYYYCNKDLINRDDYSIIFESSKGLIDIIQKETGINRDGKRLIDKALEISSPYIIFNKLDSDESKNEHNGVHHLLLSIHYLNRNKLAHSLKINHSSDNVDLFRNLEMINMAYEFLDRADIIKRD